MSRLLLNSLTSIVCGTLHYNKRNMPNSLYGYQGGDSDCSLHSCLLLRQTLLLWSPLHLPPILLLLSKQMQPLPLLPHLQLLPLLLLMLLLLLLPPPLLLPNFTLLLLLLLLLL